MNRMSQLFVHHLTDLGRQTSFRSDHAQPDPTQADPPWNSIVELATDSEPRGNSILVLATAHTSSDNDGYDDDVNAIPLAAPDSSTRTPPYADCTHCPHKYALTTCPASPPSSSDECFCEDFQNYECNEGEIMEWDERMGDGLIVSVEEHLVPQQTREAHKQRTSPDKP